MPRAWALSLAAPGLVILLGFALRVAWLDRQSLWSDEYITLVRSGAPLGELLAAMPVEHTPLYFVLLHLWFALAGSSDFALRFPSAVWGTLSVALVYALGGRVFDRRVGIVGRNDANRSRSPVFEWIRKCRKPRKSPPKKADKKKP
ncbi:MAG TPA: glycosyltransferase family 39 protein, partial [Turneriella sp.]|nr:glycosyltransferase family 39 protein [Turneriella sp.]